MEIRGDDLTLQMMKADDIVIDCGECDGSV
jgi:hypothetical protein